MFPVSSFDPSLLNPSLFSFDASVFVMLGAIAGGAAFYVRTQLQEAKDNEEEETDVPGRSLKLQAPLVTKFSGGASTWPKWKASTTVTFIATGYEKILSSRSHAIGHKSKNKIVYAILSNATVEGIAHHVVKNHEDTQDGYKAWKALIEWYDGEDVVSETAETLRQNLHTTYMVSGVKASTYINLFLTTYNELSKLKGHEMNEQEIKSLFLRNIHDPTYSTLKETLEINVLHTTLKELVLNIRKKERSMARKDDNVKRVRRLAREIGIINEEPSPKKIPEKSTPGSQLLPTVLHPNIEGIIKISPSSLWYSLSEDDKTFILNYNRAI